MLFTPLAPAGAYLITPEPVGDHRGLFARVFCADEFAEHGLATVYVQGSVATNPRAGTLRGMHWQVAPHAEVKLVRVTAGAIWDVVVDVRPDSATYLEHAAVELSAANRATLYVPAGFAHGYITLTDDVEITYQMSERYAPDAYRGARWDDPAFGIEWPREPTVIADRDATYPDFVR
ncbi:dTDP-4-dehydrorhamnose 3,5-epimerase [Longispora fulva]|uniref:dTDP-4-dehydrorhamnose 3,5-epimerase n=1 Tax=Longispora fulva TaxID=619741 RepID=A0A8J7KTL6_9ACTN|nr:dTDP-4-dehydrorhamnose 3,5-epimerase family protein [Longispora fulva]MBG6140877.1 dTDP-4-dehydrorhamnose 3,5-epimerase [Longispora fulva]GIG60857.1 dTDP-4-dehydrorhamnose 3,5-epimerase [Longispora fulva]